MSSRPISGVRFMINVTVAWLAMVALVFALLLALAGRNNHAAVASASSTSAAGAKLASCPTSTGLAGTFTDRGGEVVPGPTFAIEAGDSFFGPTCALGVPKGQVSVTFTNTGRQLHNVSIPDQAIDEDIAPGATVTITVTIAAQPVTYFCKYHRTSGMVGALSPV